MATTMTAWLLMALGSGAGSPSGVIEKFPTQGDCQYVKEQMQYGQYKCIRATIIK